MIPKLHLSRLLFCVFIFISCKKDLAKISKTNDELTQRTSAVLQEMNLSSLQGSNYTFTKLFDIKSILGSQQGLAFGDNSHFVAWDAGYGYGRISQYDKYGTEIKRTSKLLLGHSAEASYRQANGKLYIANGGLSGSPTYVYEVDMRLTTPVIERTLNFSSLGSNGMVAVDNSNGRLVVFAGPNGGPYTVANSDFDGNIKSSFSITEKLGTPQGIEVLGNEILYYTSLSTTPKRNQITIFNPVGTKLYTITIPIEGEGQGLSIDEATGTVYCGTIKTNMVNIMNPVFESSALLGMNILLNPNAEGGSGGTGFSIPMFIPFWTVTSATVLRYGLTNLPGTSSPGSPNRQSNYFAGGQLPSGNYKQRVNVSNLASDIDAGAILYSLKGWLGGFAAQNDNAKITATFLNSSGTTVGTVTIGPVLAVDRNLITGMLQRAASGSVPIGTRSILVTITMSRKDGTNCDAFADDISLVLSKR